MDYLYKLSFQNSWNTISLEFMDYIRPSFKIYGTYISPMILNLVLWSFSNKENIENVGRLSLLRQLLSICNQL